VTQYHRRGEA